MEIFLYNFFLVFPFENVNYLSNELIYAFTNLNYKSGNKYVANYFVFRCTFFENFQMSGIFYASTSFVVFVLNKNCFYDTLSMQTENTPQRTTAVQTHTQLAENERVKNWVWKVSKRRVQIQKLQDGGLAIYTHLYVCRASEVSRTQSWMNNERYVCVHEMSSQRANGIAVWQQRFVLRCW